jgi:hypothetical protein
MKKSKELNNDTITFGKYKNKTLSDVLKDRGYCRWLVQQEWFANNYSYLFNRVNTYEPLSYFIQEKEIKEEDPFMLRYQFFSLKNLSDIDLPLSEDEKKCYLYYTELVDDIKNKIEDGIVSGKENPYDIKAPTRWLLKFEKKYELKRSVFKSFISSYELSNIPYIIERVKKEGGLVYNGAQSFNIAKKRSLEQEKWWEDLLKSRYGEDIGTQFKYEKCIFDFLNISTNTIFECKLSLNDFNEDQHNKYKLALDKYRIIYLISHDCVIEMEYRSIYTTNPDKYSLYMMKLDTKTNKTYLDELITDFTIVEIEDLSTIFGCSNK